MCIESNNKIPAYMYVIPNGKVVKIYFPVYIYIFYVKS